MRRVAWRFTLQITAVSIRVTTRKMRNSAAISATSTWAINGSALSLRAVSCFSITGLSLPTSGWRGRSSPCVLRQVVNDNILPLQAFANGSKRAPQAGALLIWQKGGEFHETGHVAVITQLLDDRVRIAEQNVIHSPLPMGRQWTRELRLSVEDGCYTLHDTFNDTEILGWMIQTEETEHSIPQPEIDGELLKISGARLKNNRQFDGKWLNENDALQQAYVRANGHVINNDPCQYFTITESAEQELIKATNELHLMYLHATDKVLKDDSLLALSTSQNPLAASAPSPQWRRHHMITGRMDFCMDERGIKVYEYNADSASCHTEGGLILEEWVKTAIAAPATIRRKACWRS